MDDQFRRIVDFVRELYDRPEGSIPLHAPVFSGNEKKYLSECIDSTFVSSIGPFVTEFENQIAAFTGAGAAVACVNGTCALHLALKIVGVEQNSEVITQALTFVATANAVDYHGARPIFLDVDFDTLGLSPAVLRTWLAENVELRVETRGSRAKPYNKKSGRRISACLPMHTFGHPCRIEQIVEICNEYEIPVVEDAAESLGSFYKGRHTGSFAKIGVLSFNGNKIITTGGGGMLLLDEEETANQARHLTTQAKVPHPWKISHDAVGYNYRLPNLNAALGLAQLERLSSFLAIKRNIAEKYRIFFQQLGADIEFIDEPAESRSNFWLNSILLPNAAERESFLSLANDCGLQFRPAWDLLHRLPMFLDCERSGLENAEKISARLVNLPSSARD